MNGRWLLWQTRRWLWGPGAWVLWAGLWVWAWQAERAWATPAPSSYGQAARAAGVPFLCWCLWLGVAGTGAVQRFADGEAAWIAPTGKRPWHALSYTWVSALLASGLFLLVLSAVVWALPGPALPAHTIERVIPLQAAPTVQPEQTLQGPALPALPTWDREHRLGLWVYATGLGGPTTRARLLPTNDGEAEALPLATAGDRDPVIDGFRWLWSDPGLPTAPVAWSLKNSGSAELGLLAGRGLSVLKPTAPWSFGWSFALRAWSVCALAAAFALGLGAWLRPAFARTLFVLLALLVWAWEPFGGLRLPADGRLWAQGVGPAPIAGCAYLGTWAAAFGALCISACGLRSWGLNR